MSARHKALERLAQETIYVEQELTQLANLARALELGAPSAPDDDVAIRAKKLRVAATCASHALHEWEASSS